MLLLGILMCEMAAFTLACSMVIQRYALSCLPGEEGWLLKKIGHNAMWGVGLGVYVLGNAFYVVGLWWTPLALASALVATLLVFNTILSRVFLKSRITAHDYVGNGLILLAVCIIAAFGPTPSEEQGQYLPDDLQRNAGMVVGALYITGIIIFVTVCIGMVRKFEATYPHFGSENDKEELHERFVEQTDESHTHKRTRTVMKLEQIKFPTYKHVKKMQLVYPAVLGTFESLVQVTLKAYTGFLVLTVEPEINPDGWAIMYAKVVTWIMLLLLMFGTSMTVLWLRKVYSHFETTDCLPIEYGVVTTLSVLGGLCFYREYQYCSRISIAVDLAFIAFAIGLIGAGCYVLCFLKPNLLEEEMLEEMLEEAGATDASRPRRRSSAEKDIALAATNIRDGFFRRSFSSRMAGLQGVDRSSPAKAGEGGSSNLAARLGVGLVLNKRDPVAPNAPKQRPGRAAGPVPSIRLYRYHSNMKVVQTTVLQSTMASIRSGANVVSDGLQSATAAVVNLPAAVGSRVRSLSHDLGISSPMSMMRQKSSGEATDGNNIPLGSVEEDDENSPGRGSRGSSVGQISVPMSNLQSAPASATHEQERAAQEAARREHAAMSVAEIGDEDDNEDDMRELSMAEI
jgi:hypothetical protein